MTRFRWSLVVAGGVVVAQLISPAASAATGERATADSISRAVPLGEGFVAIPLGVFDIGSPAGEPGRFGDETQHRVTLTRPFALCDHSVTQAEWQAVMGTNESQFAGSPQCPVENVSWFDCVEFCNRLSQREHRALAYTIRNPQYDDGHMTSANVTWNRDAFGYRLPTEAEWERACRAGRATAYYNGAVSVPDPTHCAADSVLDAISWYCANAGGRTHDVKTKAPNAWGLYDMLGNVQQWCWDFFLRFGDFPTVDPCGPASGTVHVWRGGGWSYQPDHCRSADRGRDVPDGHFSVIGMRLARSLPAAPLGVIRRVR